MAYELFGSTYTFLAPAWLWLLVPLPVLWLPVFWQPQRRLMTSAALLRSLATVLIVAALAGLSRQTILADHQLALVAAVDVSDSISPEGRTWMHEYLTRLPTTLAPQDEFAALSFAAETHLLIPPGEPTSVTLPPQAMHPGLKNEGGSTNIERALERALSLYPEHAEKRLVLLTDGNETTGTAKRYIELARRMGVQIFPVIPPAGQHPEVALEKLVVPPLVRAGSTFSLRLVIRNGNDAPVRGTATILANDQPLTRQTVSLEPGLSVLEIPALLLQRGTYLLRAEITAAPDTIEGNNQQSASVTVAGKVRALVITDRPNTHLARALQLKEVETEFRRPEELPTQLAELLGYNCLVFDDVGRAGVTLQQMAVIEEYVREFGGGFLMAGGLRTFGDLGYKDTAIERILPVTLQEQPPKRKKRPPLALFILIDRSNSMGYNSKVRGLSDGQKMRYARQAATELLNQLQERDLVGVIAFDSEPYTLAPLAPLAENRAELLRKIAQLQPGGGTDFYAALETAADQLADTPVTTRHIILITDGDTNRRAADHDPLVATIAQRQISITTIRIGDDMVNLQLLSQMSEKTGGRFYHVEDVEALPQLLVKDTKQALLEKDEDDQPQEIVPRVGARGQILQGLDGFPALDEYMVTKPKNGADVQLYTDVHTTHDPLLATWQDGLGKTVAVAFDPGGSGSSEWIGWEGFGKLWSQAVRWAMRDETPGDYRLSAQQRGEQTVLQAESFDDDGEGILQARLPQDTGSAEITLLPVAPRVYEAVLPIKRVGSFPVTLVKRKGEEVVHQKHEIVVVSQAPGASLDEYHQHSPNRDLLRELAEGTGGRIDPDLHELVTQKRAGQKKLMQPLDNYLIIAGLCLVLGDICLRVRFGPPV